MAPGRAGSEVRTGFRRQPHTLAHNLAHNLAALLRSIGPPEALADGSLTSLQFKLVKIAARVLRHARAITFQRAVGAVNVGKQPC